MQRSHRSHLSHRRFGLTCPLLLNISGVVLEKVANEFKLVKVVVTSRYWCGHVDSLTKLTSGHERCYHGQWLCTGRCFK